MVSLGPKKKKKVHNNGHEDAKKKMGQRVVHIIDMHKTLMTDSNKFSSLNPTILFHLSHPWGGLGIKHQERVMADANAKAISCASVALMPCVQRNEFGIDR